LKTIYVEEINQTYKVDDIKLGIFYIVILSLSFIPQKTESDIFEFLRWKGKELRKQYKHWTKKLIAQAVRGSFEF
jgi:hypothetical protein